MVREDTNPGSTTNNGNRVRSKIYNRLGLFTHETKHKTTLIQLFVMIRTEIKKHQNQ